MRLSRSFHKGKTQHFADRGNNEYSTKYGNYGRSGREIIFIAEQQPEKTTQRTDNK
jgi:hypothetical protein